MIIGQVALSSALNAVRLGGSGWASSNVPAATRRADVDVAILLRPAIEGAQCLAHFGLQLGYEPVHVERKVQRLVVFVAARLETVGRSSLEYDSRNDARASDLIPFICILYLGLRDGKPIFRNLDELNWSRSRDKAEEARSPSDFLLTGSVQQWHSPVSV